MSNKKWTPGPWKATTTRGGKGKVETVDGFSVCNIGGGSYSQQAIDAQFISCAPAMYKALEETTEELEKAIQEINRYKKSQISTADIDDPDYWDQQTCCMNHELMAMARGEF